MVDRNILGVVEDVPACMDGAPILGFQGLVRQVPVADVITRYAVDLVRATRPDDASAGERVRTYLGYGASVHAAIFLVLRACAAAGPLPRHRR